MLQAAQLLGVLEHAATVAPWLRYMFDCLRHSLLQALRINKTKICKNKKLSEFLTYASYRGSSYEVLLRKNYATSHISKKIWHSKQSHFLAIHLCHSPSRENFLSGCQAQ